MKLPEFDFGPGTQELTAFKDSLTNLLNFGKAQFQVLSSSSAPTFSGRAGEITFVRNGTAGLGYLYAGSSWNLFSAFTVDAS